jgi:hypothetical protein
LEKVKDYLLRQQILTLCNHRGTHKILWELHEGFARGHFAANIIAKKIIDVGY